MASTLAPAETDAPWFDPSLDPVWLSRVEDAGLNASAPPQQRWVDGWLVRFSPGKAKRARCILAVSDGRTSLDDRLAICANLYRSEGLPVIFRLTPFSRPSGLDAELARRGWSTLDNTRVMVCQTLSASATEPLPPELTLQTTSLEAFAQRVGQLRGSPLAQRQAHAERLRNAPVPFSAFELRVDGELAACGQFALEADLVGLYDVFTAEAFRGRGYATHLCRSLLAEAARRGARSAYLQVEFENQAARTVYRRLGFRDAFSYHYRALDPAAA